MFFFGGGPDFLPKESNPRPANQEAERRTGPSRAVSWTAALLQLKGAVHTCHGKAPMRLTGGKDSWQVEADYQGDDCKDSWQVS